MKPLSSSVWARPLCGLALFGTLILPTSQSHAAPAISVGTQVGTVAGKLMLRFKAGTPAQEKSRVLAQVGGVLKHTYSTGWALVQVPQSSTEIALTKLKSFPQVDGAEHDRKWKAESPLPGAEASTQLRSTAVAPPPTPNIPNDPLYAQQWALHRVNAPEAWKTTTGSKDVVVAVMDDGINLKHVDLIPNTFTNTSELNGKAGVDDDHNGFVDDVHGWNSVSSSGNVQDTIVNVNNRGHGSHVSGIIGAAGNNGKLITGINWQITIVPVAVVDADGSYTSDSIAGGVDYILALRKQGVNVRVINLSIGGVDAAIERSNFDSFKALNNAGILLVCSAGNDAANKDKTPDLPAGLPLPNIITVGASNYADERWEFSNFGLKSVDIFAPGESILSTLDNSPTALVIYRGTSFSAPMVTGAAALLWASQPSLTAAQVTERILASAKRVEALRPFVQDGRRLDVGALLDNAVHTVVGVTATSDGKTRTPIGGVSIYLDDHSGTPDAITNAKGIYKICSVAGGSHTVRAELNGEPFGQIAKLNLPTSKAANPGTYYANFTTLTQSKRYAIYGHAVQTLLGGDTKPKSDVDVYLNDGPVPFARTDSAGDFKISNLPAGTYAVRMMDSLNGEKATTLRVVTLPITQPKAPGTILRYSPDGYVPSTFAFTDRVSPYTQSTNIKKESVYTPQTAPTFFGGFVRDDSAVDSMQIVLYRYLPDFSIAEMYDAANKKWVDYFTNDTVSAGSVAGHNQALVPFHLPLPTLEPKYHYEIDAFSNDIVGNQGIDTFLFQVQNSSSPSANSALSPSSAGSG
ncbi:extracellular serine proteinase [Abditibacteriota bacterium]|nr:extracellular serine proteinase [Abditibacteriota bacterium]